MSRPVGPHAFPYWWLEEAEERRARRATVREAIASFLVMVLIVGSCLALLMVRAGATTP